jgi:hypothetical protein
MEEYDDINNTQAHQNLISLLNDNTIDPER